MDGMPRVECIEEGSTLQIGNLSYYYSIRDVVLLQRRRQQQSARSLFPFSVCLILFSRNREAAMKKVSVTKRELPKISRGLPNIIPFPPPTQHQKERVIIMFLRVQGWDI